MDKEMITTFKEFTDSVERIVRFVLPGGYLVLLIAASGAGDVIEKKYLVPFVILFWGPSAYLFYREVAGVIDDLILWFYAKKKSTELSNYKAELYGRIQGNDAKAFQSYMYMKFSGAHHGIMLSVLTIIAASYSRWCSCPCSFLACYFWWIIVFMVLVLVASCNNYWRLHSVQDAHLMKTKEPAQAADPKKGH